MPLRLILTLLAALCAGPSAALEAARDAAADLREAAFVLDRAADPEARVAALTRAVAAYEAGLGALREGLRRAAAREGALTEALAAQEAAASRLIATLIGIEQVPAPLRLHPDGPAAAARAALLLGEAGTALDRAADALRADLDALAAARDTRQAASDALSEGLAQIEAARAALSQAIATRRTPEDGDAALSAALRARSDALAAFAEAATALPPAPRDNGALPLPVDAPLRRSFGQPDAAGIARPGWLLAPAPGAAVAAPMAATVRHVGPLLDYGIVIVLEPAPDRLLVLAGLGEAYVAPNDILAAGTPLGRMGGDAPDATETDAAPGRRGGASGADTLYVETREDGAPVNPTEWFGPGAATGSE